MRRILAPLIFGILGTAVMAALCVWQVQRLTWKEAVLARIEATITADPVALPDAPDPDMHRYLPVTATGVIGQDPLRVLVSHRGLGAGHRLIVPLNTGPRRVLLDLGFLPTGRPLPALPVEPVTVTGNLHWPDDRNSATPENDIAGNTWFARDLAAMAAALNTEPVLIVARDMSPPVASVTPLPVDTSAIPNDHLQYALTWLLLALVWAGMTGYYIFRNRSSAKGTGT